MFVVLNQKTLHDSMDAIQDVHYLPLVSQALFEHDQGLPTDSN